MAFSASERLTDDQGQTWLFETRIENGLATLVVTAPGQEPRRLLRRPLELRRPSVDAETPLPLDFE